MKIYPNVTESDKEIQSSFIPRPADWTLTLDDLEERVDGIRALKHMDIEFAPNDLIDTGFSQYPCEHNCPRCFNKDEVYSDSKKLLKHDEVLFVLKDAQEIGLESVKFLGPGEFLENPEMFLILDKLSEMGLNISIFTKGAELADDSLSQKYQGINSRELVERLTSYDIVRIILGCDTFDSELQQRLIGTKIKDYALKRNIAIERLVDAGLTKDLQRLTFVSTGLDPEYVDCAVEVYLWAAKRNIPTITAPSMDSGKGKRLTKQLTSYKGLNNVVNFYVQIYKAAIDNGFMTLNQIRQEGVSPYAASAPCNQVSGGLYLRLNGDVQLCPGRRDASTIYGNTHDTSIREIWVNSPNYKMGPKFNNWCPAKTRILTNSVREKILDELTDQTL